MSAAGVMWDEADLMMREYLLQACQLREYRRRMTVGGARAQVVLEARRWLRMRRPAHSIPQLEMSPPPRPSQI